MHASQCPHRRFNQVEIDQLVREFRGAGLSQREFAQKIGVHPDYCGLFDPDELGGGHRIPGQQCRARDSADFAISLS
jgi:hypothetical protein